MRGPLLSPAGALSLAGLLIFVSLPLGSMAEGPEGTPTYTPSVAAPSATEAPDPTQTETVFVESPTPSTTETTVPTESPTSTDSAAPLTETSTSEEDPTSTDSPLPPATETATPVDGSAPTASSTPDDSPSPTPSSSAHPESSPSASPTASASSTTNATSTVTLPPSSTPTASATQVVLGIPPPAFPPQSVLINEMAWAGTIASSSDEWIELQNQTATTIDLSGWRLTDGGDINVALSGSLPAYSYFLLERTDDTSIADISADLIYTGSLANGGERLELLDSSGTLVDTANKDGGAWPAGDAGSRKTMERRGGSDIAGNWGTFTGYGGFGHDAGGNPIAGTPRRLNSVLVPTATPTPHSKPTDVPPLTVLINEVAWSGTLASASDEWIELHNPEGVTVSLTGWKLTDGQDVSVSLSGTLAAYGFYLLERTDNTTVSDIPADQLYTGSLKDSGEVLQLLGPAGELVDSANASGGGWPAGSSSPKASMERRGGADSPGNWGHFTGYNGNGLDANGNRIRGTPRRTNSLFFPTPTPTGIPSRVVINEVLIRPRHDWEGTGGVTTADEFIELYNAGSLPVYLKGWWLDDVAGAGSAAYDLPGVTISPRGYAVFFRTKTKIALNDSGDTVRLMAPNGKLIDQISYLRIRAANLSYGRLPDGSDNMHYGLWPTPRMPNLLFEEPEIASLSRIYFGFPCTGKPLTLLARAARFPAQVAWLQEMYFVGCEIQVPATSERASSEGNQTSLAGRVVSGHVRR